MLRNTLRPASLILALAATGLVHASEDAVRKGIETFIGAPVVESVTRTSYGDLYEVVLKSGELIYTDAKTSFIVDGRIIDAKTRADVTRERLNQLSAIDFGILPLDQAIKQVRGNGKRVLVTFEDPNCGYCKRLGKELAQVTNITHYVFLYPILSPDSTEKSRNIWCAEDRAKTWNDWIVNGKTPPAAKCDSSVVDRNVVLGQQLRISGTPTMFLADGSRIGGYVPATELEKSLAAATR
jgi:thiol:disulfide interchange protein DsbC